MKKYHIITFGCQMNEHDSETIAGMLAQQGMEPVLDKKEADIVIINTCSVRENADKRFFGTLGQLKKKKTENPEFVVGVCGCMMQQQHVIDTLKMKYPWVDIIFGTHNIHMFPQLLENVMNEKQKIMDIWEDGGEIVEGLPAKRLYKHKAFVNIMYGCNNFCTYCIVPYTRGRERSRRPLDIVNEVRNLVADGVKEITLLGQNVNSYKGDEDTDFAALIYMLNDIEGLERIRFMTSHPKDLSNRLIQAYRDCDKLCRNIHLPVQSGSSSILKRMNRRYTKEDYLVRYDSAFTFLYSIRKGTPAEKFEDQIPEDVKHERFNRLVDTINRISAEKNAEYVGTVQQVLVEGTSKNDIMTYSGRTDGFKLVNFKASEDLTGRMVSVRITESNTFSLVGELC